MDTPNVAALRARAEFPDLLLVGAQMLDADGPIDIAIRDGHIVALATHLDRSAAARVLDARGAIVTAGLVDIHTHVYPGVTAIGAPADRLCLPSGVTTTVDGGSCGTETYGGFRQLAVAASTVRVLCFVNLSRIGLSGANTHGELVAPTLADVRGAIELIEREPEIVVGTKVRVSVDAVGDGCLPMLRAALEIGVATNTPLHVHIGNSAASLEEVTGLLRPGDMITHFQTPKPQGLLDSRGRVLASVRAARERGVLFDCGHGRTHFSIEVARRLLDQGFPPDTISSDLSATSIATLRHGLVTVMNKWLALGLPLGDVIRATTTAAAEAAKVVSAGRLEVGGIADLALFDFEEGSFEYTDAIGAVLRGQCRLRPRLTISRGRIAWDGTADVAAGQEGGNKRT